MTLTKLWQELQAAERQQTLLADLCETQRCFIQSIKSYVQDNGLMPNMGWQQRIVDSFSRCMAMLDGRPPQNGAWPVSASPVQHGILPFPPFLLCH